MKATLSGALEWKFGAVAGTRQVNPKDMSMSPKMRITSWKHATLPQPSELECDKLIVEYQTHLDNVKYLEMRKSEYPSAEEMALACVRGGQALDDMRAKIEAIDEKYKKPKGL